MMSFFRHPSPRPDAVAQAADAPALCKIDGPPDPLIAHVDYNLHPLAVSELDHYTSRSSDDDQFHVR